MMDNMEVFSWINSWLSQGEQVLWRGKPERYSLLNKKDSLMIPFSIAWCGFAIFWELSVIITGAPLLFRLWGIPFVCVGLYMVFGRFLYRRYQLRHSTYVITNRKIIRKVVGTVEYKIPKTNKYKARDLVNSNACLWNDKRTVVIGDKNIRTAFPLLACRMCEGL